MAIATGLIGRIVTTLFSLFGAIRRRKDAQRWVGRWEAYNLVGRDLAKPLKDAGPTDVSLPRWWTGSTKLTFECYDCDAQEHPTRRQTGYILIDPNDSNTARRVGRYLDSAEVYEQQLTMLDSDTILIIPVPERSTLGEAYGKHGWRRKR